jgi:chromosome segregation ATPase
MNAVADVPGGGGGSAAQIMMLTKELKDADKTIAKLERQLDQAGSPGNAARNAGETDQLRGKAEAMERNIDGINVLLAAIEEDTNKIQRRGESNRDAKKRILERVQTLKAHTASIKSANDVLLSMVR